MMQVVMIGSGNVATVLGRMIIRAGHVVRQVYSRNAAHAALLAKELGAGAVADTAGTAGTAGIAALDRSADIYIAAVADDALTGIGDWLSLGHQLVVHTAGSVSKEVLDGVSTNYGVLYPLQSLRREILRIPEIPFLTDGNNEANRHRIIQFAESLSSSVRHAGDVERRALHLAAIIGSNFTNHLYTLSEEFCNRESVDFQLLLPLLSETIARLQHYPPARLQTGPAIRGDAQTIAKHLSILKAYPELERLYVMLTESIQQFHRREGPI